MLGMAAPKPTSDKRGTVGFGARRSDGSARLPGAHPPYSAASRQHRIGQEPDRRAGLDHCDILRELGEPIGLGERSDHAGALARILVGDDPAVGGLRERPADR